MSAERRMQSAKCKVQNAKCKVNDAERIGAPRRVLTSAVHFPVFTFHFALCTRRRRPAALTLIEILIAMFIFLVGCLGVLSVFPVAINNAGRVLGETRGNILAQSVVSQITADCRVNFELPTSGVAQAAVSTPNTLARQTATTGFKTDYFVTLLDGPGRGQSRFITSDSSGTTMNIWPPWTPVSVYNNATPPVLLGTWIAPGTLLSCFPLLSEHYSITRMGLPERPLLPGSLNSPGEQILQGSPASGGPYYVAPLQPPTSNTYTYGSLGLNRDLAVRGLPGGNGFYAGIANPSDVANGVVQIDPFLAYCGMATPLPPSLFSPWNNTTAYSVGALVSTATASYYCISPNTNAPPPNSNWQDASYFTLYDPNPHVPPWPIAPLQLSSYYQVRIVAGAGAGQVRTITSNTGSLLTVTPSWGVPPDGTSVYEIGWANTIMNPPPPPATSQNATWCAQLYPIPPSGPPGGTGTLSNNGFTFNDPSASPPWNINQFQGKYVYVTTPGASVPGQARAIVSNTGTALTVTPAFTLPQGSALNYIITESYGYVLITSGRATNRLFPIAWDAIDQTDGHLIVCAGTDFQALSGITAAQRSNGVGTFSYNLQDATTFTVIGNYSQPQLTWPLNSGTAPYPSPPSGPYPSMPLILNAVPDGSPINSLLWTPPTPPAPPFCPPWFNTMNICSTQYNAGTVSLATGSQNVTGSGTLWFNNVTAGDFFSGPDGVLHRIINVGSNTTLTLFDNYAGTTNLVAGYTIFLSPPNRLAPDQYNVLTMGGGSYTSEYSYGVIFSDSGTDPSLPVRVDVLVWRNFDATKDFVENQKPAGHMAGYIKRP